MHSVQTTGDGGGGGSKDDELVASTPNQRNYKGILIALVVICAVLGLISLAIKLIRPPDEGPRVKGHKVSLLDITSRRFHTQPFNGTWISENEILYRDGLGGVAILDTQNLASTPLTTNTSFRQLNAQKYSVSPDRKFLLLIHDVTPVWEHSFLAKYSIFDIENQFKTPLTIFDGLSPRIGEEIEFQYAEWGPRQNEIIAVYQNDVYYKESVNSTNPIRITTSGVDGIVFNGIPDWLYEVEILRKNKALWISPSGETLLFASYNDTKVGEVFHTSFADSSQYPKLTKWRYPKEGTTNPEVTLFAVELEPGGECIPAPIKIPAGIDSRDHYLTSVDWISNDEVSVIWMNRVQDTAKFAICNSTALTCKEIYTLKRPELRWLDFPQPPLFSLDKSSCLLRIPWHNGDKGYFHHVVWLDINSKNEIPLTCGSFEVTHIAAWDQVNHFIYFIAVPNKRKYGERHLYRIPEKSSNSTNACPTELSQVKILTDPKAPPSKMTLSDPNQTPCLYNHVTFSPSQKWYVRTCLGPGVPTATLHEALSGNLIHVINDNGEFSEAVSALGLPKVKTFRVEVSGGYSAPVRLFLPPGFRDDEGFKFPVLVHMSGQPGSQLVSEKWRMSWVSYLTSEKNFVVVEIDARGTGFQGEKVRQAVYGQLGALEVRDHLDVIRFLKENLTFLDEKNMAVWGWGYGGYLTILALTQDVSQIFKCGIAVSPITKWEYYNTVYTERYLGLFNLTENFDGYDQGDLVKLSKKLKDRKLLVIHGTRDEKVHYQHTIHLTKALIRDKLPFTQQVYPDESHDFRGVAYHLYKTMENFLDQNFEKPDWADWEKANFLGITM